MYQLPPELIDLSGPLMLVLLGWMAVERTFGAAHGSSPAFAARFTERWRAYGERARKTISVGAAIVLFGALALTLEAAQADGSGLDDFVAFLALGVGGAQLLYGLINARRSHPNVNGKETHRENASEIRHKRK